MAGTYETDDEEGGQAPLVPLPTSRRPSRIAVAQYLSLARRRRLGARWAAHDAARRVPARHCQDRAWRRCRGRCGRQALDRILCLPAPVPFCALEPGVHASHASHSRHSNCALGAALCSVRQSQYVCSAHFRRTVEEEAAEAERVRQHERATSAATNAGKLDLLKVLTSACGSGISSLSFDGSLVRCGTPPRQPPAATASCSGEALLELRLDGHCSFSTVEAERVLEWLEQYEQRMRPSGAHDIVRMPARDFVGSEALPANGDNMFTAEALVQSLPSWFQVGYNVRHLSHLVLG